MPLCKCPGADKALATRQEEYKELSDISNRIRINSVKATTKSNSGHPTSSASCAEILAVLFFKVMKYKVDEPRDPSSDRFVMSKVRFVLDLYCNYYHASKPNQVFLSLLLILLKEKGDKL